MKKIWRQLKVGEVIRKAAKAYDKIAIVKFGEFAVLNFPTI